MTAFDNWGVLSVKDVGGLMSVNRDKVTITAPLKMDGNNISGDGWTLQLNDGYTEVKDESSDNLQTDKKVKELNKLYHGRKFQQSCWVLQSAMNAYDSNSKNITNDSLQNFFPSWIHKNKIIYTQENSGTKQHFLYRHM